jgi:glycosyltransferase involved in cell wall biosynthesis
MIRRPLRVLQVGKHFHPDKGGIEAVTLAISELLAGRGARADVLATGIPGTAYPPLDLPYEVIRCRRTVRLGAQDISVGYLRALRSRQADHDLAIAHLPNPVAAAALLAVWCKPLILFWHAAIPYRTARRLLAPFEHALIRRSSAVVALTPVHLQASGHAGLLGERGAVIGFPVDRARFAAPAGGTAAGKRVRAFLRGRKLLLSVGRLVRYKGFEVLIEAARALPRDVAIVIVGDGPRRAGLEAAIDAAGVRDHVLLAGGVDAEELNELLHLAHAGCMPSISAQEMYGVAQVEFMALGKPVIATRLDGSGVPWINRHGESGLIVSPGSAGELAAAIARLTVDAELHARLAAGAAAAFARNNDGDAIGRDWFELVEAVARGAPVPRRLRAAAGASA